VGSHDLTFRAVFYVWVLKSTKLAALSAPYPDRPRKQARIAMNISIAFRALAIGTFRDGIY
jgi:hypothetical protein